MSKTDKNLYNHETVILVLNRENKINTKVISIMKKKECGGTSHTILNKLIREGLSEEFTDTGCFYLVWKLSLQKTRLQHIINFKQKRKIITKILI